MRPTTIEVEATAAAFRRKFIRNGLIKLALKLAQVIVVKILITIKFLPKRTKGGVRNKSDCANWPLIASIHHNRPAVADTNY